MDNDCRITRWMTAKAHYAFTTFSRQMKEHIFALDQTITASLLTKLYSTLDVSCVFMYKCSDLITISIVIIIIRCVFVFSMSDVCLSSETRLTLRPAAMVADDALTLATYCGSLYTQDSSIMLTRKTSALIDYWSGPTTTPTFTFLLT